MGEKRFELWKKEPNWCEDFYCDVGYFIDNKTGNTGDFEPYPYVLPYVKLLNELNDENEQLRQRYYALKKENDRLENNIIHLNESNDCKEKNLKIMELSDTEHNLKMLLANSDEQTEIFIKGLQDENEKLRQQITGLKEDVPLLLGFYRWYPFAVTKKEHQIYKRLWDFVNDGDDR